LCAAPAAFARTLYVDKAAGGCWDGPDGRLGDSHGTVVQPRARRERRTPGRCRPRRRGHLPRHVPPAGVRDRDGADPRDRLTGGANQGVWLDGSSGVALRNVVVSGNPGVGVQLKGARATTVSGSTLSSNGSAGLKEASDVAGTAITSSTITGNGRGGSAYNGDGLQLGGTGAVVRGNTITGNGDPGPYEHGVDTGSASNGWLIEQNTISGSGGANVKAMGTRTIRGNRLVDGRYGLVLASNPVPVDFTNVVTGRAQHLVFLTTRARGRLYHDTIRQTGNTHACYGNSDNLGVALWINDRMPVAANGNWYCSRDALGRHVAYGGSRTTASAWRTATGADSTGAFSAPPTYDSRSKPLSPLAGAGIGAALAAVPADVDGVLWPATGARDAGAIRLSP
jgi:parallel beta-helix repeat protein